MQRKDLNLLPHWFKWVGLGIAGGILLVTIMSKVLALPFVMGKDMLTSVVYIGLLLVVLAKERVEDELLMRIRLKAYAASFIYGVCYVVMDPIINGISDGVYRYQVSVDTLLLSMFCFYFLMYYLMKWRR